MIFYLPILIFIVMEVYYVYNKSKLDSRYKNWDLTNVKLYDVLYYLSRTCYYPWLIFGAFTQQSSIFIFLLVLIGLRLPFYYISKRLYAIWDNILPSISIIFMLIAFVYYIKG